MTELPVDSLASVDSAPLRHVLLWVQFDGTDFCGFQRQAEDRTVAGTLEQAWQQMLGETIVARSSSRTDSGVHARRMPVLVRTRKDVPPRGLMLGLNSFLPADVAVHEAEEVAETFDVRGDAVGKRYVYRIWEGPARSPVWRRQSWHVRGPLDLSAMQAGARLLEGVHDFSTFRGAGCVAATTIRHMRTVSVVQTDPHVMEITVDGNAFLLNMVRIFAGTLVDIGRGRFLPEDVSGMIAAKERTRAGQTAPAHGLTLDDVFYGPHGARHGLDYKNLLGHMEAARVP